MLADASIVRNKNRALPVRVLLRLRKKLSVKKRRALNRQLADTLRGVEFTVFSNNCLAGVFYHDAGRQFTTPTVNMAFDGEDFIKFCEDPKRYFTNDFSFFTWPGHDYPIAANGGIEFRFVHYKDPKDCVEKWLERSKRIVWNNIFIVATDVDGMAQEEWMRRFDALPYENKIMFTAKRYPRYEWAIPVRQFRRRNNVHIMTDFADFKGRRYYETAFDIAGWIKERSAAAENRPV